MTQFTLPGDIRDAFSHMALIGLAAIVEVSGDSRVAIRWSRGMDPRPEIESALSRNEVATTVHKHASDRIGDNSWLSARSEIAGRSTAVFSPRVKAMTTGEWSSYMKQRERALDRLIMAGGNELDLRMIGALGMPASWSRLRAGDPMPDDGASRWEMKTRNRGEEFVGNRLALLSRAVAKRSVDQVASGLYGATVVDELGRGKNPLSSRTPTGLRAPGPVDSALAWCALWGISQCPVRFQVNSVAKSAGFVGSRGVGHFYLPVFGGFTTMPRVRTVLISSYLLSATTVPHGGSLTRTTADSADIEVSAEWLRSRSVRGFVIFEMAKSDNLSAPERWAKAGIVHSTATLSMDGLSKNAAL